jgi:hypothetical protein
MKNDIAGETCGTSCADAGPRNAMTMSNGNIRTKAQMLVAILSTVRP